jgi:mannose-6-phosphate isomerase-like protein (cupin superfamily)
MIRTVTTQDDVHEYYTEERCFITELINTPDYAPVSVARARVEPGVITEWHQVKDTDEMYYILSGEGDMEIEGREAGPVRAQDLVFIPRNTRQRIRNTGQTDLLFLCICAPRFEQQHYVGG